MVGEFLHPKCHPCFPCFLGYWKLLPLFVGIIEHAHQHVIFYLGVDHCFGADGDFHISNEGLTLLLFFDVDSKRFVYIHGLVEKGFVVLDHGFGDECKAVKNVEDDVMEGALVVPFIGIPEFGEVIIRNHINEEVAEECLHCEGHVMGFLVVLVHSFRFGMARSHCAGWDIGIQVWVMGDYEVVAVACEVKFILHCKSKMSFLFATSGAGDVDSKRFIYIHRLVEKGFVVLDHGFGDECKAVKNVEDDVMEGALVVPFIGIPEFGEVIIRNHINEEVAEECLHCEGHVMGFLVVIVHCFKFGMVSSHCAGWDIGI